MFCLMGLCLLPHLSLPIPHRFPAPKICRVPRPITVEGAGVAGSHRPEDLLDVIIELPE